MSNVAAGTALGGFDILRVADAGEAQRVAAEFAAMLGRQPGTMSSHLYVSDDGTAVVHCGQWLAGAPGGEDASPAGGPLRRLSADHGVRSVRSLSGTLTVSIDGHDPAADPGYAVLAIRHVRDAGAAGELAKLLRGSGDWKQHAAGFIGASAYTTEDGHEFLNYPRWVDQAAYEAYMADPRIAEGQGAIAALEVAKPEFFRCRRAASVWPQTGHTGSRRMK
jgi:quinol monooxygenase YgiN